MNSHVSAITEDVWRIYATEHGNDARSAFEDTSVPLTAISELPAIACHHIVLDDAVAFFVSRYQIDPIMQDRVAAAAQKILAFASLASTASVRAFLTRCAELYLMMWTDRYDAYKRPSLPRCSHNNSALVDLASGPDFVRFFFDLLPTTTYYAVDRSFFAVECIRLKAEADGLHNVTALNKDVMDLTREDIKAEFIETIRAKNIFRYVPRYLTSFHKHLGWIGAGGSFVFAEQASESSANAVFCHDLVKRKFEQLVGDGWGFSYALGDFSNPLDINTVTLSKSREGALEENLRNLGQFYIELDKRYGTL